MIINGIERKFFLSVGASCAIAELCPDGDMANIGALFEDRYAKKMSTIARFIVALNRGYEDRVHPDAEKPNYLTYKEVMSLTMDEFNQAEAEALSAYSNDTKTTINLTDPKGSKKKRGRKRKLNKAWLLFYGLREFHMTREQVLNYPYGEFLDLISCLSVYNGNAVEKDKPTFDQVLSLLT